MADNYCEGQCNLVGNFPVKAGLNIISANLRTRTEIRITSGSLLLRGPTTGDLSITAYAPLTNEMPRWKNNGEKEGLWCAGKAGVSFTWNRRTSCDAGFGVYFIPGGISSAYKEGAVTSKISMTEVVDYRSFSASAASGPFTIYSKINHIDGYNFQYLGDPINITASDAYSAKTISIFEGGSNIMPENHTLYLTSFSWDYTPPNVPIVSYSFVFLYSGV